MSFSVMLVEELKSGIRCGRGPDDVSRYRKKLSGGKIGLRTALDRCYVQCNRKETLVETSRFRHAFDHLQLHAVVEHGLLAPNRSQFNRISMGSASMEDDKMDL